MWPSHSRVLVDIPSINAYMGSIIILTNRNMLIRMKVLHYLNILNLNYQKCNADLRWQLEQRNIVPAFCCIMYCSAQLYSTPSTTNLLGYHWLNTDSFCQKYSNLSFSFSCGLFSSQKLLNSGVVGRVLSLLNSSK